jgi:hypothetical protein
MEHRRDVQVESEVAVNRSRTTAGAFWTDLTATAHPMHSRGHQRTPKPPVTHGYTDIPSAHSPDVERRSAARQSARHNDAISRRAPRVR